MLKIKSRIAAFCGASLLMAGTALAADVKVAAISGYFAQGFGQSIVAGLNKAKDDFGVEVKLIDTGNRALDYEEQFNNVAKDGEYDLVFVMGWELVDALTKAAEAYPDQRFIFIDGVLDSDKIVYADFSEEEGSFVTGAFASLMAAKGSAIDGLGDGKSIGFVGGRDIPVIRNFLRGYEQSSGRKVDRARLAYWEIMANVRWAAVSVQQARRHLSGADESLELCLTGCRTAEIEFEILRLIEQATH